jgi:hypothetical protein
MGWEGVNSELLGWAVLMIVSGYLLSRESAEAFEKGYREVVGEAFCSKW